MREKWTGDICWKCGKDTGNYPIWIQPAYGGDPPTCYCPRVTPDNFIMKQRPCKNQKCYEGVTLYPCECEKEKK